MQKKMRQFVKQYNQEYGATIILTSHYMEDVKRLCKRVIVIDKGQIIFDGMLSEIIKKYADHKVIEIFFQKTVEEKDLKKFGQIKKMKNSRAVLMIKRSQVLKTASAMLQVLPIEDININEPRIEDIIREIFTGKNVA